MNKIEENILALIRDLKDDTELNISISYEHSEMDDMYYIFHDVENNDFNEMETLKINTKLVEYLDSKGIINYTFGYSEHTLENEPFNHSDYISISFSFVDDKSGLYKDDNERTTYSRGINRLSDNNAFAA